MPSTKVNDLEIILKAKNEASNAFGEVSDDIGNIDKLANVASGALVGLVSSAGAALVALTENGKEVGLQLKQMGTLLGVGTEEAGKLFAVIRENNPKADIDALTDGLLTLTERFSEARVETGELFAFAEDFGLEFDRNISGSREEMIEFLKVLKQLPDPADRVTTAIAVMGDEGARQFNPIIQDMETIEDLLERLEGDLSDLFSAEAARGIDEYAKASGRLANAYDDLSLAVFSVSSEKLAQLNTGFAIMLENATELVEAGVLEDAATGIGDLVRAYATYSTAGLIDFTRPTSDIDTLGIPGDIDDPRDLDPAFLRRREQQAAEAARKAKEAAEKAAERRERELERSIAKEIKGIERVEAAQIKAEQDRKARLAQAEEDARAIRAAAGLDSQGFTNDAGFTSADRSMTQKEIDATNFKLDEIDRENDILNKTAEDTLLVADAFGALEGAIGGFSNAFLTKGSRAFKAFIALQAAAATASAYSAGAQALADFSNLSTAGKIAAGFKVLGIGLGWATQIASLSSAASSANAGAAPQAQTPSLPQAPDIPEQGSSGATLNVNIQSRTLNDLISVDVVENILELASEIPGGISDINFNRVVSG